MKLNNLRGRGEESTGQEKTEFLEAAENGRENAEQSRLGNFSPCENTQHSHHKTNNGLGQADTFVVVWNGAREGLRPGKVGLGEVPRANVHSKRHARECDTVIETRTIICRLRMNANHDQDDNGNDEDLLQRGRQDVIIKSGAPAELREANQCTQHAANHTV